MEAEPIDTEIQYKWYVLVSPLMKGCGDIIATATLSESASLAIDPKQNQMITGEEQNYLIISNLHSEN